MIPVLPHDGASIPCPGWDRMIFAAYNLRRVLDVGANYGGFVQGWLASGATEVHAIEPVPECYDALVRQVNGDPRVTCHRIGVSDAPGEIRGANVYHCWTLLPEGANGRPTVQGPIAVDRSVDFKKKPAFDVELATIDDLLTAWDFAPDFIKIDVDGYDAKALRGARRYLAAQRPILMLELSPYPKFFGDSCEDMVRSLFDLGYVLTCVNGGERLETFEHAMRVYPWHTSYDVILRASIEATAEFLVPGDRA